MRRLAGFTIAATLAWAAGSALLESRAAQPAPFGGGPVMGPTAIQQSQRCPPKGGCVPLVTTFGYVEPKWSTWPGEQRIDKVIPSAIGREQIPPPPPFETLPVPEAVPPQGAPQGPIEGGPLPPERPSREVLPPGEPRGPIPGIETPAETDARPPEPRGGVLPALPPQPATPPEEKPAAPQRKILPDAPPPSGLPIDPTGRIPLSRPEQSQVVPPAPISDQGYLEAHVRASIERQSRYDRVQWQDIPHEPAPATPRQPGIEPARPTVEPVTRNSTPGFSMVESVQPVAAQLPADMRAGATVQKSSFEQPVGQVAQVAEHASQAGRPPVAFDGFCPVDLSKNERWTKGDPRWTIVHQGQTYLLSGPVQRECFLVDPARYVPGFSGCDPVAVIEQGRNLPGSVEYCVTYDGKIYMFSNAANLAKFRQDARRYTAAGR